MNLDVIENLTREDLLILYEDILQETPDFKAAYHCVCKSKQTDSTANTLCYHIPDYSSNVTNGCCVNNDNTNLQGCRNYCNNYCGQDTWVYHASWACYWNICRK